MCVFCQIVNGEIPCKKVYENEWVLAFEDINPQAPVHVVMIPKVHKDSISSFQPEDDKLMIVLFKSIQQIVAQMKLQEKGFRVVVNTGVDGGQTVDHLHFHILGGRILTWPPG